MRNEQRGNTQLIQGSVAMSLDVSVHVSNTQNEKQGKTWVAYRMTQTCYFFIPLCANEIVYFAHMNLF